uniref:GAIN-B domain-containing protein n=1 Tax=Magallana gigas TaxID=29159 RepID=A0A8W8NLF7_MAGGI
MSDIFPSKSVRDPMEGKSEQISKKKEFVNSPILSLTTQNDLGVLMPPLNLTFGHIKNNESTEMHAFCVSWDFPLSKWTERGCKVSHSDSRRTVCQCNHLTNFAILMRPYSPGACIATTVIIHYFFLVTFFSMLGMGVYYFMSITVTYYAMYVANNFKARSRVHWFLLAIWVKRTDNHFTGKGIVCLKCNDEILTPEKGDVMQGLKNKYPAVGTFISIAEHSKKETTSVSRSQSTSKPTAPLVETKKKGLFEKLRNNKVKKSESFMTERTASTDCPASVSHEQSFVMSENNPTNNTMEPISQEGNTMRRFRFSFNLNPWKKKYTVTEM